MLHLYPLSKTITAMSIIYHSVRKRTFVCVIQYGSVLCAVFSQNTHSLDRTASISAPQMNAGGALEPRS